MHDQIEEHKSQVATLVSSYSSKLSVSDPEDVKMFFQWYVRDKLRLEASITLETTFSNICSSCGHENGQNPVLGTFINAFGLLRDTDSLEYDFGSHIKDLLDQRGVSNVAIECNVCQFWCV